MLAPQTEYPIYLFNEGTNYELYKLMKCKYGNHDGRKSWRFRCFAPRAASVSIVGDFNNWDRTKNPMYPLEGGIWEVYVKGMNIYDNYKFSIETAFGNIVNKADPFALHTETPEGTASKVYNLGKFVWTDREYLQKKKNENPYKSPINIYEVHLGSWKRNSDGSFLSYRQLADSLVSYVKEMGYTHVEIMPIAEHPFEGSWGYQVTGLFAPSSRYGTPHDFMYLIDKLHSENIGVILDFVISHFPKDEHGLYEFDGLPLFEYEDELKREHKGWGTMVFDYGRPEIRSFLISACAFWFDYYHIDGMRLDAVASMLYLDYDRKDGEWKKNIHGGNYNLEAIEFLQKLNTAILTKYPHAIMIAEESTAFPKVTMPPYEGGLGFNFKWNMGWMNDILSYIRIDPFFRKGAHDKLTFPITYAFSENYILPFSHDEVVHGKASMVSKMPGGYDEKFSALRSLYAYMFAHPGKKLNFMGNEFAQFIEWDYTKPLDWMLKQYENHKAMSDFCKELNMLYLENKPLYEQDSTIDGFTWLVLDDNIQNIIAFYRTDSNNNKIVVIVNFSDVKREGYKLGVPDSGTYDVILDTNSQKFGGKSQTERTFVSEKAVIHGCKNMIKLDLSGNQTLYLSLKG